MLDSECTPDALRAFELADRTGRAELARNRWAVLAELGAPALVVPEAAGGLGRSDVDLVGVLEEAGRACLPEPLLETAALAAPTLAALLPDPTASAALSALVEDDAGFAVGGIDVTAAGIVSPTEVTADGTAAHAPRRRRPRRGDPVAGLPRPRVGLAAARGPRRVVHGA